MNDDVFNLEIRKFLKQFGVTAQREIERAVTIGHASGTLQGNEILKARVVLTIEGLGTVATVDGARRRLSAGWAPPRHRAATQSWADRAQRR